MAFDLLCDHVDMVGHDAPCREPILIAVGTEERLFNNGCAVEPSKNTFAVSCVQYLVALNDRQGLHALRQCIREAEDNVLNQSRRIAMGQVPTRMPSKMGLALNDRRRRSWGPVLRDCIGYV